MARLSAVEAVWPALDRTREVLLEPLMWGRGLVICLFASLVAPAYDLHSYLVTGAQDAFAQKLHETWEMCSVSIALPLRYTLIGVAIVCGLVLVWFVLLAVWRIPFMMFDLVSGRRREFGDLWRSNGSLALQWFGFSFCLALAYAPGLLLWHFLHLSPVPEHVLGWVLGVAAAVFGWLVLDFLVPILSLEGGTVPEAFRRLWRISGVAPSGMFGYVVLKAVLVGIASIPLTLLWLGELMVVERPVARSVAGLLQAHAREGVLHFSAGIVVVVLACLLLAVLFLLVYVAVSGMIAVFFEAFSLYFFAGYYPPLQDLMQGSAENYTGAPEAGLV